MEMIRSSKWMLWILLTAMPEQVRAQGVRMSPDFLPLEVGNRWIYEVTDSAGQKVGDIDIAVRERAIREGRSYYLVTQFPLTINPQSNVLRYDRQRREFLQIDGEDELALFPAEGASAEVVEADASGLPKKFRLTTDELVLVFERGVGIVEATLPSAAGPRIARLTVARVGQKQVGEETTRLELKSEEQQKRGLADNVGTITEENPVAFVEARPTADGHAFVLVVRNIGDKLLPFNFPNGQTFDFAVIDPSTGQEIWRWSRGMFFTQVVRSEAIRPRKEWRFEAQWNHRDTDLNRVPPGQYRVIGFVSSRPSIETEPATFEVR